MSVLAVAAHPDDEVLGCAGALARHVAQGERVTVLILGQGVFSRSDGSASDAALENLRSCAREANRVIGVESLHLNDFPDNRMDAVALLDIVKEVEAVMETAQPRIVYTHFPGDLNVDHRRVSEAVCVACRPLPNCTVRSLRFFEVQSSTDWRTGVSPGPAFVPNLFVDISATLETKLSALRAYGAEMRPWPHSRSIQAVEHLARWRGATVGRDAAEAFVVGRTLE